MLWHGYGYGYDQQLRTEKKKERKKRIKKKAEQCETNVFYFVIPTLLAPFLSVKASAEFLEFIDLLQIFLSETSDSWYD